MTQRRLAELAQVSARELRRIEVGQVRLSGPVLFRIAHALNVQTNDLVEPEPG